MNNILPDELIIHKIIVLRWEKILLDRDLANLYWVETRVLNQAVSRNIKRFPQDFMFELNNYEFQNLKSQIVTSSWWWIRKNPKAFTEHWILMLSAVLRSKTAIDVSIHIIRIFNRMRKMLSTDIVLTKKLHDMEQQILDNSEWVQELWFEFKKILEEEQRECRKIWFDIE